MRMILRSELIEKKKITRLFSRQYTADNMTPFLNGMNPGKYKEGTIFTISNTLQTISTTILQRISLREYFT